MSNKVNVLICIDAEVKEKAHKLGLSISKVTEQTLRAIIQRCSPLDELIPDMETSKEPPKKEEAKPEEVF